MKGAVRFTPLVLVPLLALGCAVEEQEGTPGDAAAEMAAPAVDLAAEDQAIRARIDAWEVAAMESGEAFAGFYTPDGVLMAPGAPPMEGRAAIAEGMAPLIESLQSITFEPLQIRVAASGDLATERGRYTLTHSTAEGGTLSDEGSYIVVWEKIDGQWMVTNDIFNSDMPAEGM